MNLSVFAAGSLRKALPSMAERAGVQFDIQFGPAGLLRRLIEEGARPDLYFSASMEHVSAVSQLDAYAPPREFAENRLCLFGREEALVGNDPLAAMLSEDNRLGSSTPGADPGGDYAFAVFDRAEAVRPGSRKKLRSKVLTLVGGDVPAKGAPGPSPVVELFTSGKVNLFLGYRTTATDTVGAVEGLTMMELPPELAVRAVYGVTCLRHNDKAWQALDELSSADAVKALEKMGFIARRSD